jgi:hypothetical protein
MTRNIRLIASQIVVYNNGQYDASETCKKQFLNIESKF